ncbi:MAG: hypothetical protein GX592_03175 [Clostridiales bacterium]|nr:hypothetical protein [Clostridiales bacterium]
MRRMEKGPGFREGMRDFRLNASNISSGITGMVFSVSGIVVIFSNIATQAGLTQKQVVSWMFAAFLLGGLLSVIFSFWYKMPLVFTNSLPGMMLAGALYASFDVHQMVGGFMMAGALVFLVGVSGLMDAVKRILPIPIVMGMVAGVFLAYAVKMVGAVQSEPFVCGVVLLIYLATLRLFPKVPAQLVALIAAGIMVVFFSPIRIPVDEMQFAISSPVFVRPAFTFGAFVSVSVPIALLALADSIKGYGVLKTNGYNPPMNSVTTVGGLVSILAGPMLSNVVGFAGVGTAIVATDAAGPRERRYAASVIKNFFSIALALLVGFVYPLLHGLPVSVSNLLAGLAMLSLFTGSLSTAFGGGSFRLGAFAAMVVGIADISVASVGAPIVALVVGTAVSFLAEPQDFKMLLAREASKELYGREGA